jgi:hypothetical protein
MSCAWGAAQTQPVPSGCASPGLLATGWGQNAVPWAVSTGYGLHGHLYQRPTLGHRALYIKMHQFGQNFAHMLRMIKRHEHDCMNT